MDSNGIGDFGKFDFMNKGMYPMSQIDRSYYASPTQVPLAAQTAQADYDPRTNPLTGEPVSRFADGGIANFRAGGTPEERKAAIADVYKKILGRDPNEGENLDQWYDYTENQQGIMSLADRLAQTEEGIAYGKSNPKDVFAAAAALSQEDSPFKGMDTPYSNMRYLGAAPAANDETTQYKFQDQNGGIVTTNEAGKPVSYEPGRGWYDEQFKKHPDALRNYGYRNQTYLASGPLDKTYNINGVEVPVAAQEYQVDPKTKQIIAGKTGDYKPLELKPQDYDWFNDWGGPAMVVAIPAAASVIAPAIGGAAAGTAAGGATAGTVAGGTAAGTTGALTTAELMGGAGGAFAPAAGSGAIFTIPAGATYTAAGAGGAALGAGEVAGGAATETIGQALPYTESFDAANMAKNGYDAATISQNLSATGMDSFMAQDMATMAANGYSPEAIQQAMQYGYSSKELAPMGLDSLQKAATAGGGLTAKQAYGIKMGMDLANSLVNQGQGNMGPSATTTPLIFNPNANKAVTPGISPIGSQQYGQLYDTKANTYDYFGRRYAEGGITNLARGGSTNLGSYSDGGHLLRGPGDGMSDHIPATIGGKQPARLADGEFVIPADVVSHLGNGSTDAGAKQLYKMMDRIRKARTGRKQQGKKINPDKYMIKG